VRLASLEKWGKKGRQAAPLALKIADSSEKMRMILEKQSNVQRAQLREIGCELKKPIQFAGARVAFRRVRRISFKFIEPPLQVFSALHPTTARIILRLALRSRWALQT